MQQRHFRWYGAETGRTVVYFHGVPGSIIECGRFHEAAQASGVRLIGLERSATDIKLTGDLYFERHANEVLALVGDGPFEAIGFSGGAFVAMRCAPYLRGRLTRLHLVAPAAPLECGDFRKAMASRALLSMAERSPTRLRRFARFEGWLAQYAPPVLLAMLFSNAKGADRALAADPVFRSLMTTVLRLGLGAGSASFARDMREYVRPWAEHLAEVSVETSLWCGEHGQLDAARHERERSPVCCPNVSARILLPGLSHYSILFEAVPRILAEAPPSA